MPIKERLMRIFWLLVLALWLNAATFETLSSRFVQTVVSPEGTTLTYTGSVHANAKDQALWIYETPVEKKIYFNKTEVLILEPDLEQAITASLQQAHNLMGFLQEEQTQQTRIVLHEGVEYTVTFQHGLPATITYKDSLENRVSVAFSEIALDVVLPIDLFTPFIPKHFDIIHQ